MSKGLLKQELVEKVGLTKKQAEEALECIINTITETVKTEGKLSITGWGTFKKKVTKAKEYKNHINGEITKVPAKQYIKFKMSEGAKEIIG